MGPRTHRMLSTFATGAATVLATLLLSGTAMADHNEPDPPEPPEVGDDGPGFSAPCGDAADACLDLSENRSWLMDDGQVIYGPVPVTHGRPGYETPPGVFNVTFKDKDHISSIYNAPMPYSVFFNGGIAFHQGSLQRQSHGCVHLSWEAAETYFYELQVGDVVQVVP